jgi:hypothetical protein
MTDAEQNALAATDTFRRFVGMLADTTAYVIGWREVALVLAAAASDALAAAARESGPVPPERGGSRTKPEAWPIPGIQPEDAS